jgi:hypothetical protein
MGAAFMLTSHIPRPVLYIFAAFGLSLALNYFTKKTLLNIGEADANTFSWIFYGMAIINPLLLIWFCAYVLAITVIYFSIKKIIKHKGAAPINPVLSISFAAVSAMYGLYY